PAPRRAPVRPVSRQQHPAGDEEPGLCAHLSGGGPHTDRQGGGPGSQEDRGPAQARPEGPDSREVMGRSAARVRRTPKSGYFRPDSVLLSRRCLVSVKRPPPALGRVHRPSSKVLSKETLPVHWTVCLSPAVPS